MDEAIKKVACLYRVSTKKQVTDNDIPLQKKACRAFIEGRPGWELAMEYTEKGVSGYHKRAEERDVLQQMKADAGNGCFDVLLVFMFDRLGRREDETPFVVEWLVSRGIEVWSVTEGQQTIENRTDKLLNYLRFWQSGGESEKTGKRVWEKHKQMAMDGVFRGGSPPYGYRLVWTKDATRQGLPRRGLALDDTQAPIVRRIYQLAADYAMGGGKIAQWLNAKAIPTQKGGRWTGAGVLSLLKNPVYKGWYVYGKRQRKPTGQLRLPEKDWITALTPLPHLAIVSEAVWARAEALRQQHTPKPTTPRLQAQSKSPLLFSGLVFCMGCGQAMGVRYGQKRWRLKTGEVKTASKPQYTCRTGGHPPACPSQHTYSQNKIDPVVLSHIFGCLPLVDFTRVQAKIEERKTQNVVAQKAQARQTKSEQNRLNKELAALQAETAKALLGESPFTPRQLATIIQEKEAQLLAVQEEASQSHCEPSAPVPFPPDWQKELLNAPPETQKMVLSALIERIEVSPGHLHIYFKHPLPGWETQAGDPP